MMDGLALSSSELFDVVVVQPGATLTLTMGARNPQQHHPDQAGSAGSLKLLELNTTLEIGKFTAAPSSQRMAASSSSRQLGQPSSTLPAFR